MTRLRIERREVILNGKTWGAAGAYEKLIGKVDFALDPKLPQNQIIVDLDLAPKNAQGLVEFSADFYLIKPVDSARGNGRLFYEAGNRGTMRILSTFQNATNSDGPGDRRRVRKRRPDESGLHYALDGLAVGRPAGPHAHGHSHRHQQRPADHGLGAWQFHSWKRVPPPRWWRIEATQPYPVVDAASAENRMVVHRIPTDPPAEIPRSRWRFTNAGTVTLDGGFEAGLIYDVIYRARDPRVVGVGLAGTRDIVSFFKHADATRGNPMPGITLAIGWGVSQTGRFLRHFVYQGFNEDEHGRQVFDGVIDQLGGAGRGSFNHRFGQQSRISCSTSTSSTPSTCFRSPTRTRLDPETGLTDGLLARARRSNTVPKFFHVMSGLRVFQPCRFAHPHRCDGHARYRTADDEPHLLHRFGTAYRRTVSAGTAYRSQTSSASADMNTLVYTPVIRALFRALDQLGRLKAEAPPASRYPRLSDGTLATVDASGWPNIPHFPQAIVADDRRLSVGLRAGVVQRDRGIRAAEDRQAISSGACQPSTKPAMIAPEYACRRLQFRWRRTPGGTIVRPRLARRIAWRADWIVPAAAEDEG